MSEQPKPTTLQTLVADVVGILIMLIIVLLASPILYLIAKGWWTVFHDMITGNL
jgi:hypothetical protein